MPILLRFASTLLFFAVLYSSHAREYDERPIVESKENEWKAEIHTVINPRDSANIIAATMASGAGGQQIQVYTSLDFGATWQQTFDVPQSFDPIVAADGDGTLYVFYFLTAFPTPFDPEKIETHLHYRYSTDKGKTWQKPANDKISADSYDDKEWAAADIYPNSPHNGTVYVVLTSLHGSLSSLSGSKISLYKKTAGSASFSATPIRVTGSDFAFVHTPSMAITPDGAIHIAFSGTRTDGGALSLWHTASTDGGETFSQPIEISSLSISANEFLDASQSALHIPGMQAFPSSLLTTSPTDGSLHLVWHGIVRENDAAVASNIHYARSLDNGATWSTPRHLNDNAETRGYYHFLPTMAMNSKGKICASWYDGREAKGSAKVNVVSTYSTDNGATFSPIVKVNGASADLAAMGTSVSPFSIGHYTQMVCTDGYAIPFWSDGRTGDAFNLYCAFVPLSPSSTGVERVVRMSQNTVNLAIAPNPTSDNARLTLSLTAPAQVQIRLTDITGKTAATLLNQYCTIGDTRVELAAHHLARGTYVCSVYTDGILATAQQVTIQ